jgi:hypothetical protein
MTASSQRLAVFAALLLLMCVVATDSLSDAEEDFVDSELDDFEDGEEWVSRSSEHATPLSSPCGGAATFFL